MLKCKPSLQLYIAILSQTLSLHNHSLVSSTALLHVQTLANHLCYIITNINCDFYFIALVFSLTEYNLICN